MPEDELAFGDESELARIIREAIGVGPYDSVIAVTPEFDRVDGIRVTLRPKSAEQLDKIKRLPDDSLVRIGVGRWSGEEGWTHYIFPHEWYDCIPEGYPVVTINDEEMAFSKEAISNDRRFGFAPFGWVAGDIEAWREHARNRREHLEKLLEERRTSAMKEKP